MLILSGVLVVVALPLALVVLMLRLAASRQRRQAARLACQIAVTDAIHRELGAVAAPSVEHTSRGDQVVIPLSTESAEVMHSVLSAARRGLERFDAQAAARMPIVLLSRPVGPAAGRVAA